MSAALQQVGRLAFRHEGDDWVAYYAPETHSMVGAQELARVKMGLVASLGRALERQTQFIALVRDLFADICEARIGVRPAFPAEPQPAPEHERSGRA